MKFLNIALFTKFKYTNPEIQKYKLQKYRNTNEGNTNYRSPEILIRYLDWNKDDEGLPGAPIGITSFSPQLYCFL